MSECRCDVLVADNAMLELLDRARSAIYIVMDDCELPRGKSVVFTDEEIVLRALESYCENLES